MSDEEQETVECVCGTEIPAEGVDYEPQCRFCEREQSRRLLATLTT